LAFVAPSPRNIGATFFLAFLGGLLSSVAGPCVKAAMINVNDPESRGVAMALQVVILIDSSPVDVSFKSGLTWLIISPPKRQSD